MPDTPAFWGANPAETRSGAHTGHRPLALEEDLARKLVTSLDEAARKVAIFQDTAPRDILTGAKLKVEPLAPAGLRVADLAPAQRETLLALLHVYLDNMKPDLAAQRLAKIRSDSARSQRSPNIIVPRHISESWTPVVPKCTVFIENSFEFPVPVGTSRCL